MTRGMYKSGRFRKIFVKTPGGRTTVHYREQKPQPAHCAHCHKALAGVPRENPAYLKKLPKSSRRPERPYGGYLCSACTRAQLKLKARQVP